MSIAISTSRRSFLGAASAGLAAVVFGRPLFATAKTRSVLQAVELNHLSLDLANVERAEEFYKTLFGLTPVDHGRGSDRFMHFQQGFLNMRHANDSGMNHFCLSVKDFDPNSVFAMLDLAETNPFRMGGRNLHCYDPNDFNVQVQEERHGWGRINGSQLTYADRGTFKTVRLHHVSLKVKDLAESRRFYEEMFGLEQVGDTTSKTRSLMAVGPAAYLELTESGIPGMDHYCYAVEGFDAEKLPEELRRLTGHEVKVTDGVARITDPNGISVEITSPGKKLT